MRRLTACIYRAFFGLQIVSQRQHIIDLEQQLVDRCAEQAAQRDAERKAAVPALQSVNDAITREFSAPDAAGPTIKLGEICTRLGFNVTADFLASLGVSPVATEKNAKLYPSAKFPTICRLISDHVLALAFKKAA